MIHKFPHQTQEQHAKEVLGFLQLNTQKTETRATQVVVSGHLATRGLNRREPNPSVQEYSATLRAIHQEVIRNCDLMERLAIVAAMAREGGRR